MSSEDSYLISFITLLVGVALLVTGVFLISGLDTSTEPGLDLVLIASSFVVACWNLMISFREITLAAAQQTTDRVIKELHHMEKIQDQIEEEETQERQERIKLVCIWGLLLAALLYVVKEPKR